MKKVIALALALVLALSLGVSAFAAIVTTIELEAPSTATSDGFSLINNKAEFTVEGAEGEEIWYVKSPEGGNFYIGFAFAPEEQTELKNIVIEKGGNVSKAEVIAYDPSKYTTTATKDEDGKYKRWGGIAHETYYAEQADVQSGTKDYLTGSGTTTIAITGTTKDAGARFESEDWKTLNDAVKEYNLANKTRFVLKTDWNIYVVRLTVDENYGTAFTEGWFQIKADKVDPTNSRKTTQMKSEKITVISDVALWDYDTFLWATENEKSLIFKLDDAYSDYKTYLETYVPEYKNSTIAGIYLDDNAAVVSTTEFRAAFEAGKGVTVEYPEETVYGKTGEAQRDYRYDGMARVVIPAVAASQKGVNFWLEYDENRTSTTWGKLKSVELNFLGADVIASDATVEVDLPYSNVELLNDFGKKVEEEDMVTYYILKNGKTIGSFTVDYLKDNWNEQVKFDIVLKAGEALGDYTLSLEGSSAAAEETNPNTGAEAAFGIAFALAAVTAVAAISLKK